MLANMTPARKCRLAHHNSGRYYNQPDLISEDFEYHEKKLYELAKEIREEEQGKCELEKCQTAIFMASIGMFCFGYLDVIDDIIGYFHLVPRPIKTMVWVLRELLPLPQEIGIDTPDLFKQWLFDNRNKLEWSEKEGKYLLLN